MKEEILKLIKHLEEEKVSAIALKANAECELDEGFFNGIQTAYKHVIGTLEAILAKKGG